MFCSKCGAKIKEGAEFCEKCGKKVISGENSKEDSLKEELKEEIKDEIRKDELKEEIKKELKKEKPKTKWSWASCLAIVLVFFFVIGVVTVGTGTAQDKQISIGLMVFPAVILGIWFAVWLIIRLVRAFAKNKRKTLKVAAVILGAVFITAVVPAVSYIFLARNKVTDSFSTFQKSFGDVIYAKYLGDDIIAGKANANLNTVKATTQTAMDSMAKVKDDDKYYNAVYDWAEKINKAAANRVWWNLPDLPSGIGEVISKDLAESYYQASLNHVAVLKDYGDWAIAKGDKDAMRQVAAELKAEEVWQNNLSDQLTFDYDRQALAATSSIKTPKANLPRGGCKGVVGCRKQTSPLIKNLSQAARNYSVGTPDSAKEWKGGWDEMLKVITIENGYNLEGMGVIQNGEVKQQTSPMEQAFNDDCKAKGGTTGGTGGVKDRLPTTLTAGTLNCDYKDSGRTCWDVMTRTGQRFMGGENGCTEQNLLPKPAPVPEPPTPVEPTASWDGTYHVAYSTMTCNTNVSTGYSQMFNSAGFNDTIVVSGNRVRNFDGSTSQIDSAGNATYVSTTSYSMASLRYTTTYHLSGSGISGRITMVVGASYGGASSSVNCSETFSGSK